MKSCAHTGTKRQSRRDWLVRIAGGLLMTGAGPGCRGPSGRGLAKWGVLDLESPGWTVRRGQVVWRTADGSGEWVGDLIWAGHADARTWLQFSKSPFTVLTIQTGPGGFRVEWHQRHAVESNVARSPDTQLWLELNRRLAVQAGVVVGGTAPGPGWELEERSDGGWRFACGEGVGRIAGYLDP